MCEAVLDVGETAVSMTEFPSVFWNIPVPEMNRGEKSTYYRGRSC